MFWRVFHEDLSLEDKKKFLRKWPISIARCWRFRAEFCRLVHLSVEFCDFLLCCLQLFWTVSEKQAADEYENWLAFC